MRLMMRELITRFGRENLGVLWLVGEPMMFTWASRPVERCGTRARHRHTDRRLRGHGLFLGAHVAQCGWTRCSAASNRIRPLLFHRSVHIIDVC